MDFKNALRLIASILICQLAGIVGSFFTVKEIDSWYAALEKPSFSPPNWLFGPAWITLYTLMGIALFLVWKNKVINRKTKKQAIMLFVIHLLVNAVWSIIFFRFHSPFYALLNIVVLLLLIIIVMAKFYRISKTAGYLLIPYLLWVSFATLLNFAIWQLN